MSPTPFWRYFDVSTIVLEPCSLSDNVFHDFSENVLPALVGTTVLDFRPQNGSDKIHFGHVIFSRIVLLLVSSPLYSLDATQAGPQKTSQILAILLPVAWLIERLQPCIRHHFADILMYPTQFCGYCDLSHVMFGRFSCIWPNLGGISIQNRRRFHLNYVYNLRSLEASSCLGGNREANTIVL